MVRDTGFEPVTPSVSGRCSTTELTALGPFCPGRAKLGWTRAGMQPLFWMKKRREIHRSPALGNPAPKSGGGRQACATTLNPGTEVGMI